MIYPLPFFGLPTFLRFTLNRSKSSRVIAHSRPTFSAPSILPACISSLTRPCEIDNSSAMSTTPSILLAMLELYPIKGFSVKAILKKVLTKWGYIVYTYFQTKPLKISSKQSITIFDNLKFSRYSGVSRYTQQDSPSGLFCNGLVTKCIAAVPFPATAAIKKVAVMSKLTPKQIQLIATDEANLVASMYYHERNCSVAATEGVWQRVYDRVIGTYLAAGTPLVTSTVSKPVLTAQAHDALFGDVQDTYDGLLEMCR